MSISIHYGDGGGTGVLCIDDIVDGIAVTVSKGGLCTLHIEDYVTVWAYPNNDMYFKIKECETAQQAMDLFMRDILTPKMLSQIIDEVMDKSFAKGKSAMKKEFRKMLGIEYIR